MDLERMVDEHYDDLTAREREVVTVLFRDKHRVQAMSSEELAAYLNVSRTTVVRLMKKLGIARHAELKLLLKGGAVRQTGIDVDVDEIARGHHAIISELAKRDYRRACEMIGAAGTVYLLGSGNEQKTVAEEFKRIFAALGVCCLCLFDVGEVDFARQRFEPGDLLIAISLSGEGEEVLRAVRHAQASGVATLSITRWHNNSLARMCQESLYVGTKTLLDSRGRPYEMVAAFYILLDVLAACFMGSSDEGGRSDGPR